MINNNKLSTHDIGIAEAWYQFGVKENFPNPNFVFQFMSKWVAFNFLYTGENSNNHNISERSSIHKLLDRHYKYIKDIDYDNVKNIEILKELPVYGGRARPEKTDYDNWLKALEQKGIDCSDYKKIRYYKTIRGTNIDNFPHYNEISIFHEFKTSQGLTKLNALFQTIYQIRCNLFHASKMPITDGYDRDEMLIEVANDVLGLFLEKLIQLETCHP